LSHHCRQGSIISAPAGPRERADLLLAGRANAACRL